MQMRATKRESSTFNPSELVDVETLEQIRAVAPDCRSLMVRQLDDQKLAAIATQAPELRHLITDGNNRVSDAGLRSLQVLNHLEWLDLEWSLVTDDGLEAIGGVASLRWVDVGFCRGVTEAGVAQLRRRRPDLDVVFAGA